MAGGHAREQWHSLRLAGVSNRSSEPTVGWTEHATPSDVPTNTLAGLQDSLQLFGSDEGLLLALETFSENRKRGRFIFDGDPP
jgi:hypothetical protein